jgi:hypothetical protein
MKLRKLTILLLLIAAQLHAFAQSAEFASVQNNTHYSPAPAAERFDAQEVVESSIDTTKKGSSQASKKTTEVSKKATTTASKSKVEKSKTTSDKSKSTTDKSRMTSDKSNQAAAATKINPDSFPETETVTSKSDNNNQPKPITVSVRTTVDSTKKVGATTAKSTAKNTAKDSVEASRKIVNASPKVATETPKKPATTTVEPPKKGASAIVEPPKKAAATTVEAAKKTPASTPVSPQKTIAETPTTSTKVPVKETKTTPSVSAQKNAINETATVRNASILNGEKDDFSPTFFENGLLYCSNSKKVSKSTDKSTIVDDLNLKFAVIDSLGSLAKPTAFSRKTNSKTHEGPSCFSSKGDTMFLTRVMSKGGVAKYTRDGTTTLKIYIKVRDTEGNYVGEAVLPFESENFSYCHPTLSTDGQRLYFSSNMPGGFGGMDLWMSRKMKTGEWSKAMNMGSRINTAGNELFPHYAKNGIMYFSSNGRKETKGRTDLDIFSVDVENKIALPNAMPEAFNTEGDDFGIMFLPTPIKKGFFSSNRKGGSGGDDIYEFEIK